VKKISTVKKKQFFSYWSEGEAKRILKEPKKNQEKKVERTSLPKFKTEKEMNRFFKLMTRGKYEQF
jgi:nucleoid DNA-binding protein